MKIPFWDYLFQTVQLNHYGMLNASVNPQPSASVKPEWFYFTFFITHIMKIHCVNYTIWSVEICKGSRAAEKNKKSGYEHV